MKPNRLSDQSKKDFRLGGRRPVETVLQQFPSLIRKLWILPGGDAALDRLRRSAVEVGVPILTSDRHQLSVLSGTDKHQGVAAEIAPPPLLSLDSLITETFKPREIVLALDHLQDPRNVGAVLRTAACHGVRGVILPTRRASPITEIVIKTSAGGAYLVPIIGVSNLAGGLRSLKKEGWWLVGASPAGGRFPDPGSLPSSPVCLVLGSEGKGIRPIVDHLLDDRFSIPQPGAGLSLNVSVAAGILLFAFSAPRPEINSRFTIGRS